MPTVQFPVLNFQDFIAADGGGRLITSSHQVCSVFGKRHADVLRATENIIANCPPEYAQRNFALVMESMTYVDSFGDSVTKETGRVGHIEMTKNGFILLAMGFTGKKAMSFKIAYINAFDAMADFILNKAIGIRFKLDRNELEEKDSFRRGSIHGRGLRERRIEKPLLKAEHEVLSAKLQPFLPMFEEHPTVQ